MLLLRAGDVISCRAALPREEVFALVDRYPPSSSENHGGRRGGQGGTRGACQGRLTAGNEQVYRTACRRWKEVEVLIVTGATAGKVEANNTAVKA